MTETAKTDLSLKSAAETDDIRRQEEAGPRPAAVDVGAGGLPRALLQRKLARRLARKHAEADGVAPHAEEAVGQASRSAGGGLPASVQRKFEGALGADLSAVRLHTGAESAAAAESVGARAYTIGQDIHFGHGQYSPDSAEGEHLLAHEVAHTIQQAGGVARPQCKLEVSSPGDAAEREADTAADAMVRGQAASVGAAAPDLGRAVQREPLPKDAAPNPAPPNAGNASANPGNAPANASSKAVNKTTPPPVTKLTPEQAQAAPAKDQAPGAAAPKDQGGAANKQQDDSPHFGMDASAVYTNVNPALAGQKAPPSFDFTLTAVYRGLDWTVYKGPSVRFDLIHEPSFSVGLSAHPPNADQQHLNLVTGVSTTFFHLTWQKDGKDFLELGMPLSLQIDPLAAGKSFGQHTNLLGATSGSLGIGAELHLNQQFSLIASVNASLLFTDNGKPEVHFGPVSTAGLIWHFYGP